MAVVEVPSDRYIFFEIFERIGLDLDEKYAGHRQQRQNPDRKEGSFLVLQTDFDNHIKDTIQ